MRIRSINDVITNSSDEVLVLRTDRSTIEVLASLAKEIDRLGIGNQYSGMGGVLEVADRDHPEDFDYSGEFHNLVWLPSDCRMAQIDFGYIDGLRGFLKTHYEVLEDEVWREKYYAPWLKSQAEAALVILQGARTESEIKEAYSKWSYWNDLVEGNE